MLDPRGRPLRAALAAVLVRDNTPELRLMHEWLDLLVQPRPHSRGDDAPGWDLQLTACASRDQRANFFPLGIALRRRRLGLGADAVAVGAAGGVGCANRTA